MSQILKGIKFPGMEDVFIAPDHNNMIHTTLYKTPAIRDYGGHIIEPKRIYVNCHNLTPGKKYKIRLYGRQRCRGAGNKGWKRINQWNYIEQKTGYAALYHAQTLGDADSPLPAVPSWMSNGGILKSEWEFTATDTTYGFDLNIYSWILDLLKPEGGKSTTSWKLIGVRGEESRLFQFRIYDIEDDYEGEAKDFLKIGKVEYDRTNQTTPTIGYTAIA